MTDQGLKKKHQRITPIEHFLMDSIQIIEITIADISHCKVATVIFQPTFRNFFYKRCDEDMAKSKGKDPLEGLGGPMTRARARKAKEALQQVLSVLFEYKPKFQGEKSKVVSCIMAQMEED